MPEKKYQTIEELREAQKMYSSTYRNKKRDELEQMQVTVDELKRQLEEARAIIAEYERSNIDLTVPTLLTVPRVLYTSPRRLRY